MTADSKEKEKRESYNTFGFKMAIFGQTFMESIQNTLNNTLGRKQNSRTVLPVIVDVQVDEATRKVQNLKKFIESSHKSIKTIIDSMTATIEAEQSLTALLSEESCKEDKEIDLRISYIKLSDSYNKDNKELSRYIIPLKNYEDWLNTFLTKAIRDTEDTISACNQVRIEIQTYSSCLVDAKERVKTEVEGSMEYISDKRIIEESERHLEASNAKFAQLKVQLKEKAEMLELKRKVDLPNYLETVHTAMRLYHQAAFSAFTPKDSEVESVNTVNDGISSEGGVSLNSLPSSLPSSHNNSVKSFGPR